MGEHTRRVAAGFDDPHEADRARARLEAERADRPVEENAPEDLDVAYGVMDERGDSIERQPDITLAVEVPEDEIDEDVIELVEEGAEIERVDDVRTGPGRRA